MGSLRERSQDRSVVRQMDIFVPGGRHDLDVLRSGMREKEVAGESSEQQRLLNVLLSEVRARRLS